MNIIDDAELRDFVGYQESSYLVKPSEIHQQVAEQLEKGDQLLGERLPWRKCQTMFGMRPGEVSVWAGINGHGKSAVLGQVIAHICKTSTGLIASLEMPIVKTMSRIVLQMAGTSGPETWWIERAMSWYDDRLWLYDQLDTVDSQRILALCYYAAKKLDIKHIVIDSLVKCGLPGHDGALSANQRTFVDALCMCARQTGLHIHLVHHMRKGEREESIPTKFDVKGAGEIVDLCDNLIIVHRNKGKENRIAAGEHVEETEPDTRLIIAKQRHFAWEGTFLLWYDKRSGQYMPSAEHAPTGWRL